MSEHDQQKAVIKYWRAKHPKQANCLFSIPNGTHLAGSVRARSAQMNKLKAEGLVNGVSDLFLMIAKGGYHGLFIEMKDQGKTKCSVSDSQQLHINTANKNGYLAVWCAGAGQAIKQLDDYMRLDDE